MARTFAQMEEEEISAAEGISAAEALATLENDQKVLLVDVRGTAEMDTTGVNPNVVAAPGRAPSYRGAAAANVLTSMGFQHVRFVDGGMAALINARATTQRL